MSGHTLALREAMEGKWLDNWLSEVTDPKADIEEVIFLLAEVYVRLEAAEAENVALRASASKSVLRRLEAQGAITAGESEK